MPLFTNPEHKNDQWSSKKINIIIAGLIILWPLVWSFLGIDMADTGSYMYYYSNPDSGSVSLLTYFSTLIGSLWYQLYPSMGLWWMQFLEVLLVWITSYTVYRTIRNDVGKTIALTGILLSVILSTTYIKIFNFHQFNMLVSVLVSCALYKGLVRNSSVMILIAGVFSGVLIFIRIASIPVLLVAVVIFYHNYRNANEKKIQIALRATLFYILGVISGVILVLLLYVAAGVSDRIIDELNRLNSMGSSSGDGGLYSMKRLIYYFVIDSAYSILSGIILIGSVLTTGIVAGWMKSKRAVVIFKLIMFILIAFLAYILIYKTGVYPRGWALLTGYNWILYGLLLITGFIYFFHSLINSNPKIYRLGLLSILGIFAMVLSFVGSGVRLRHVILGTWILMPIALYLLYEIYTGGISNFKVYGEKFTWINSKKYVAGLLLIILMIPTLIYMFSTNMYDSNNILALNSQIESPNTRLLRTTERQADAVNEVISYLDEIDESMELMVYGNSVLLYYLAERNSYVKPWIIVTSYSTRDFRSDLELAQSSKELPIIILNRTDPYYGFYDYDYDQQLNKEISLSHNGKKNIFENFMNENSYSTVFKNDYYEILTPGGNN